MNRDFRRAQRSAAGRFAKQATGRLIDTALIECGTPLASHKHGKVFQTVIADLYRRARDVKCLVCGEKFALKRPIAAVLLACVSDSTRSTVASASGICLRCWISDDLEAIELAATRVLSRVVPGGRFLDAMPPKADTG